MADRRPLNILVVDDIDANRRLVVSLLRNLGYAADAVASGREAVESVLGGKYDLVLMDERMPDIDGLEATRRIRAKAGLRQPRIVALTASASAGDRKRCLAAGMDDYLPKPVEVLALRAVLETSGPADRAPQVQPAAGAIDWRRLESLKAYDPDGSMVAGVIASFLADAPGHIQAISAAHAGGDAQGAAAAAHALKGSAANIGAAELQRLSQSVETLARDGQLAGARMAIGALEQALVDARAALGARESKT